VATQVVLTLDFHPKALVGKTYKASPDQLFLGNARPGPDRRLSRRVGNVERNKAYAFLYTLSTPTDQESPLPLVHATLSYDVPALNIRQAQVETTFGVHLSKDRALTERQDGAVLECYRRVQITELVERFVDAHHAGRAQDTSRYLDLLIKKYNDVNDQKMVNHYQKIRSSLVAGGLISRPMINASVVASTVVRGGGELPQLVSDDF
jgi:hypothetical protein